MKTWTLREVAEACDVTTSELSQWIARGHFWPSAPVRPGQQRRFDWRDLASLATMAALRKLALPVGVVAPIVMELRAELDRLEGIDANADLVFYRAGWSGESPAHAVGLVSAGDLIAVLASGPVTMIVVVVATAFREATKNMITPDTGDELVR
ncbi:MAG: MerR family transcriptional regulator [Maritimibacter sp.]|nr:MerR family transcriptional regulator [Maritimibacter sp.]